jgi:glycosyltransferase involved in cell wall biosynthesis
MNQTKIAIVVSHPIQHFCPQYVSFAENARIELMVFFASSLGLKKYRDPNFKQEVSWGNLRLESFNHQFLNGDIALPSGRQLDVKSLDKELDNFKPALVIIYGYYQKFQRRAHRWAKSNRVPLAYISDSELRHQRNFLKEMLKYFFIRKYFKSIQYFLSVGDANEEFYRYYCVQQDRVVRMHFPIDIKCYETAFDNRILLRRKIRERYYISPSDVVLIVVGKLVAWKNQDHIIEAMQVLEDSDKPCHLLVVGSGEMLQEWEQKSKQLNRSKVYFTGFVSPEDLPAYYAASDIYVHPASIEPHSIAISEAIFMGCPVVVSDCCGSYGPTDDVQEGKNGYVFKFGNIDDLASKIGLLTNDVAMRERFGIYSHNLGTQFQKIAHFEVLNKLISEIKNRNSLNL